MARVPLLSPLLAFVVLVLAMDIDSTDAKKYKGSALYEGEMPMTAAASVGMKMPLPSPKEEAPQASIYHQYERPPIKKPKSMKVMTAYDVCKAECRKERDKESAKEYIERLKEELRVAEEHEKKMALLQEQEKEKEQAQV